MQEKTAWKQRRKNRLKTKEKRAKQNDKIQKNIRSCFRWVGIWLNDLTKLKKGSEKTQKNREKVQGNYKN